MTIFKIIGEIFRLWAKHTILNKHSHTKHESYCIQHKVTEKKNIYRLAPNWKIHRNICYHWTLDITDVHRDTEQIKMTCTFCCLAHGQKWNFIYLKVQQSQSQLNESCCKHIFFACLSSNMPWHMTTSFICFKMFSKSHLQSLIQHLPQNERSLSFQRVICQQGVQMEHWNHLCLSYLLWR